VFVLRGDLMIDMNFFFFLLFLTFGWMDDFYYSPSPNSKNGGANGLYFLFFLFIYRHEFPWKIPIPDATCNL
jgi:hypothetical protein